MNKAKVAGAYTVLLGSYKPVARLPGSYMPCAYRYQTNQCQCQLFTVMNAAEKDWQG